jgi:hypothetical protein
MRLRSQATASDSTSPKVHHREGHFASLQKIAQMLPPNPFNGCVLSYDWQALSIDPRGF